MVGALGRIAGFTTRRKIYGGRTERATFMWPHVTAGPKMDSGGKKGWRGRLVMCEMPPMIARGLFDLAFTHRFGVFVRVGAIWIYFGRNEIVCCVNWIDCCFFQSRLSLRGFVTFVFNELIKKFYSIRKYPLTIQIFASRHLNEKWSIVKEKYYVKMWTFI